MIQNLSRSIRSNIRSLGPTGGTMTGTVNRKKPKRNEGKLIRMRNERIFFWRRPYLLSEHKKTRKKNKIEKKRN